MEFGCAEPDPAVTPITKGLVFRVTAPAERNTCIFPDNASTGASNPHPTSNIQRTVRPRVDGGLSGLGLLGAVVKALEVQRSGGKSHHHLGDLIRCPCIHRDPWPGLRLEDLRQSAKAVAGVNAQLGLPGDRDLVITIHPLYTRLLALFVLVIGFVCHCHISSLP
jgi:hypothetical protein